MNKKNILLLALILFLIFTACNRNSTNIGKPEIDSRAEIQETITESTQIETYIETYTEEPEDNNIKYILSSHVKDFMLNNAPDDFPADFSYALDNRAGMNPEKRNQIKEKALAFLNEALSQEGWYSDGQEARRGDKNKLTAYMILAALYPDDNSFIESAKRITYGESWYDYPVQYTAVVFLDIILKDDERTIEKLTYLRGYLNDILESQNHDAGHIIIKDIELIDNILSIRKQEEL